VSPKQTHCHRTVIELLTAATEADASCAGCQDVDVQVAVYLEDTVRTNGKRTAKGRAPRGGGGGVIFDIR
jgi:hypothetical protein